MTRRTRTLIGLFAVLAMLAAAAFTSGDRARAGSPSVQCVEGYWALVGNMTGFEDWWSGVGCDAAKPGWVFDWDHEARILWVYDGDRVATPYTDSPSTVIRTEIREVQEQGNKRPPVNQPVDRVVYEANGNNRAVLGDDGNCYREERFQGRWQRSGSYGTGNEQCRRASWNAYYRSQERALVHPNGDFPQWKPPSSDFPPYGNPPDAD
ncbi:MAG: hypothetical protein F4Y35_08650 [Chloroflexi bacterium]|nr:hypothetical protein [Chloroflexota bacterium]